MSTIASPAGNLSSSSSTSLPHPHSESHSHKQSLENDPELQEYSKHASLKFPTASLFNRFRGLVVGFLLPSSMLISHLFTLLFFPLLFISPKLYHLFESSVGTIWYTLPILLFEYLYNINFVFYGDVMSSTEKTVMIPNHRTRLDWMFLWPVLLRQGSLFNEKIIMKSSLGSLPLAGPSMQMFNFIFLTRKWENDEKYFTAMLRHFMRSKTNYQILIFPEGTDLDKRTVLNSHAFARKNNLPLLQYVLHPRVKGFTHILHTLQSDLDSVYDITIGYDSVIPTSELDLLFGKMPTSVHVHIKKFSLRDLPPVTNEAQIGAWCSKQWLEKEERLKKFYTAPPLSPSRNFGTPLQLPNEPFTRVIRFVAFVFWMLLIFGYYYLVYLDWRVLAASIVLCVTGAILTSLSGGLEKLELKLYPLSKDHNKNPSRETKAQ